ncbi:hypothetical protein [Robertmurraya sp.]|uniref:hypothetical protein n=1 Tax=Robertmurraya sp. TaxID=2837525 RepID=UPI0037045EFA
MRNFWLVRPNPHNHYAMGYFLTKHRIAVGYPLGEDLTDHNYRDIKILLEGKGWPAGLSNVNILVREMNPGDWVIVPDENGREVYIGEVTSDYKYVEELDEDKPGSGFPHQREVEWFFDGKPFLRSELPGPIKDSLRYPGAVANLTKHLSLMEETLGVEVENDSLDRNSTEEVIDFLLSVVKNEEIEMENRLRAAEIILNSKK